MKRKLCLEELHTPIFFNKNNFPDEAALRIVMIVHPPATKTSSVLDSGIL